MAFQQSDLDNLDRAIATGASEVRWADGSSTRYRSLAEMMRIRDQIAVALAGRPRTLSDDRVVSGYDSGLSRGAPAFGRFGGGGCF